MGRDSGGRDAGRRNAGRRDEGGHAAVLGILAAGRLSRNGLDGPRLDGGWSGGGNGSRTATSSGGSPGPALSGRNCTGNMCRDPADMEAARRSNDRPASAKIR